jgi:hypothetical protein
MLKAYRIKNPDIENSQTILKSANRYKLDTMNFYTVSSKFYLKKLKEADGITNASIYDSKGEYIEYRKTDTSCNAGLFNFIPNLKVDTLFKKGTKENLKNEYDKYRDLFGNSISDLIDNNHDFYLVIYQSVWTGNLNKDHVKVWEDLAKNNRKSRIKVVKINLDIQQYWDSRERDNIIKKLEGKK